MATSHDKPGVNAAQKPHQVIPRDPLQLPAQRTGLEPRRQNPLLAMNPTAGAIMNPHARVLKKELKSYNKEKTESSTPETKAELGSNPSGTVEDVPPSSERRGILETKSYGPSESLTDKKPKILGTDEKGRQKMKENETKSPPKASNVEKSAPIERQRADTKELHLLQHRECDSKEKHRERRVVRRPKEQISAEEKTDEPITNNGGVVVPEANKEFSDKTLQLEKELEDMKLAYESFKAQTEFKLNEQRADYEKKIEDVRRFYLAERKEIQEEVEILRKKLTDLGWDVTDILKASGAPHIDEEAAKGNFDLKPKHGKKQKEFFSVIAELKLKGLPQKQGPSEEALMDEPASGGELRSSREIALKDEPSPEVSVDKVGENE